MEVFARCFLLVFGQLAVGGFVALSVPPFHELERGFYKSTAGVYLGIAAATVAGQIALLFRADALSAGRLVEVAVWLAFCAGAGLYLTTLWGERVVLRARAFSSTLLIGVAALAVSAQAYRLAGPMSLEAFLYPVNFFLSALLLGTVTTGMILGHWYLIERGLSIEPLKRILKLFAGALVVQVVVAVLGLGLLGLAGSTATTERIQLLFSEHWVLLLVRVVAGPVAALGFAAMIWRTLLIPQTMAATGLFYIATLFAVVGEMLGRFILFRTSLPF